MPKVVSFIIVRSFIALAKYTDGRKALWVIDSLRFDNGAAP